MKTPKTLKIPLKTTLKTQKTLKTDDTEVKMDTDNTDQDITSKDLMNFLQKMAKTMLDNKSTLEEKIDKTNKKIDVRFETIDEDMREIKDKIEASDEANKRMENRLSALETEMTRSEKLGRKSSQLRDTLRNQLEDSGNGKERQERQEEVRMEEGGEVLRKTYRSDWARRIEEELEIAAKTGGNESGRRLARRQEMEKEETVKERGEKTKETEKRDKEREAREKEREERRIREVRKRNEDDRKARDAEDARDARDARNKERGDSKERSGGRDSDRSEEWREWRGNRRDGWRDERKIPDSWEEILEGRQKENPKVRKPPVQMEWFGFRTETEDSESEPETGWTEVDRRKKNEEKKRLTKRKKKELMETTATRASSMIGLGPVNQRMIEEHRRDRIPYEESKALLVRDFLMNNLDFDEIEMEELRIMETRLSNKGDGIINVAFETQEQTKQIHIRRAEIGNEDIVVRNYIPPTFYQRYMEISNICKEKRNDDAELKTQLRFGRKDVEVFVKHRGENMPFRKIDLKEFTDKEIPQFDHKIKWKRYIDRQPMRKMNTMEQRQGEKAGQPAQRKEMTHGPITRKNLDQLPAQNLRRQISSNASSSGREGKKHRLSTTNSGDDKNRK